MSNDTIILNGLAEYKENRNGSEEFNNERIYLLPQRNHLLSLMTILRDGNTPASRFAEVTERVADQLIGAALDLLPAENADVVSPTASTYNGVRETNKICGVSILRGGASLENALRREYTGPLSFGKILIQRDEETCLPSLLYSKFPPNIQYKTVLILEPMLATGGSACMAIDVIKSVGVPEENIIFVNLVASKRGLERVFTRFPSIRLVTAAVDEGLTLKNHIDPGLGDFGDRFYGTVD